MTTELQTHACVGIHTQCTYIMGYHGCTYYIYSVVQSRIEIDGD